MVGQFLLSRSPIAVDSSLFLLTGKTYYRRLISKNEEPFNFWFTVGCLNLLAVLFSACFMPAPSFD
jgi:hypothetical protein